MQTNRKDERPVDKGWAWMICFAAFIIIFIIAVANFTMAVLFLDIVERYDSTVTTVSFSFMAFVMSFSLSSVIFVNTLVPKYGERKVVAVSGLFFAAMNIGFAFAPTISIYIMFSFFQGVLHGGLYVPPVSMISQYFVKRRSLATTLVTGGMGVGLIAAPPMIRAIVREFGIQGTYLILCGIELHIIPASFCLRPISFYATPVSSKTKIMEKEAILAIHDKMEVDPKNKKYSLVPNGEEKGKILPKPEIVVDEPSFADSLNPPDGHKFISHSLPNSEPHFLYEKLPKNRDESLYGKSNKEKTSFEVEEDTSCSVISDDTVISQSMASDVRVLYRYSGKQREMSDNLPFHNRKDSITRSLHSDIQKYIGSTWSIATGVDVPMINVKKLEEDQTENESDTTISQGKKKRNKILRTIAVIFDLSLFRSWKFRFWFSSILFGATNPYLLQFLPTITVQQGATKDESATLLTILGCVDLFSRLVLGMFADTNILTPSQILAISHFLLGIVCHLMRLFRTFNTLIVQAVLIGLFCGTRQSLMPMVLIDVVGIKKLSSAFGMTAMITTFFIAIYSPLLSSIMEATGSFTPVLHIIGTWLMICAAMVWLVPYVGKYVDKENEEDPSVHILNNKVENGNVPK